MENQAKYDARAKTTAVEPKAPEEIEYFTPEWTPKQPASVLYEQKFAAWAKTCGFRDICAAFDVICNIEMCPFEQRERRR